jgi:hypothetical protein
MSGDLEQEDVTDAMAEEIAVALGRVPDCS